MSASIRRLLLPGPMREGWGEGLGLPRRRLLSLLAASSTALALSACDVWNLVGRPNDRSPGGSPLSIPALRARNFPPSEIRLHKVAARHDDYTSYVMSYNSDGLHITGMATIPSGRSPFPVVLLNHGYVLPSQYATGVGTRVMADALGRRGVVTLATDYRGLGGSQDDSRLNIGARLEFVIDVLNLASAAREFPEAQPGRIGVWGHSLGGELAIRAGVVDPWIGPIALWAPLSVWLNDISDYYRVPTASSSDQLRAALSAGNYLEGLTGPVDIHQGGNDLAVNPAWASKLRLALGEAGVASNLYLYPGVGHLLNASAQTVVRNSAEFLRRNLPTTR